MTTIGGLPAHILLVHAIVVLLPLASLLLIVTAVWPAARRRLAGPNAVLAVITLALVPVTTNAGEWLQQRVEDGQLVRDHTELGDTALFVAIPVAVLALLVWWRGRESTALESTGFDPTSTATTAAPEVEPGTVATRARPAVATRRTFLAPASSTVTIVLAVLSILVACAAIYDVYLIGESGARATWQGSFSQTPRPDGGGGSDQPG